MAKLSKINLTCYLIRFRDKGKKVGEYYKFSDLFPKGFVDFTQKFTSSVEKETFQAKDKEEILDIDHLDLTLSSRGILVGTFEKGTKANSGAAIKEIKSKKAVKVRKIKGHEYTTIPYFFLMGVNNPNTKACVFIAQTFGVYGFKEIFTEALQSFVKKEFDDEIACDVNALSNPKLFKKVIETSSVRKLRYRKHSLPEIFDEFIADEKLKNDIDRKFFDVELSISAKREGYIYMRNALDKMTKGNSSFIEFSDGNNFVYDDVYADVNIGDNKRVVNLTKPSDFGSIYDVGSEIKYEDGIPVFDTIKDVALSIYEDDILKNADLG